MARGLNSFVEEAIIGKHFIAKEVALTREELAGAPCVFNHMEVYTRDTLYGFVLGVKSFMLEKKREAGFKMAYFDSPDGWWQHFKKDCFPAWLLRRFPVRTKRTSQTIFREFVLCCPHSNVKWEDDSGAHVRWMMRGPISEEIIKASETI